MTSSTSLSSKLTRVAKSVSGLSVLIVDDHAIVRDGLKQLVTQNFEAARIGETSNSAEAIECVRTSDWDVVLLDISLPGQSGVEVLKQIKNLRPGAKVLILTMHPENHYAVRVLKAGAAGYMTKETAAREMVAAISKVLSGGKYISPTFAEKLATNLGIQQLQAPHEVLSDREYQVLRMIAQGKTVKEISFDLEHSIKTVSTYRTRVLDKMNFSTKRGSRSLRSRRKAHKLNRYSLRLSLRAVELATPAFTSELDTEN